LDGCETNGRIEPFKRKLAGEEERERVAAVPVVVF
jgi:hypothetical protein